MQISENQTEPAWLIQATALKRQGPACKKANVSLNCENNWTVFFRIEVIYLYRTVRLLIKHILHRALGVREDTSHMSFRLMTLYGVIIQASQV